MRRMRDRMLTAEVQYKCTDWSYQLLKNQWHYAKHLSLKGNEHWGKQMTLYMHANFQDPHALHLYFRCPGRPQLRWDDRISKFCRYMWPERRSEHWLGVISSINVHDYETQFINFSLAGPEE